MKASRPRVAVPPRILVVTAAVFAAALALLLAGDAPQDGIISRGSAVQGGEPPQLTLMVTGEVMGWTEPCG